LIHDGRLVGITSAANDQTAMHAQIWPHLDWIYGLMGL
jgi:hypothetical protein